MNFWSRKGGLLERMGLEREFTASTLRIVGAELGWGGRVYRLIISKPKMSL